MDKQLSLHDDPPVVALASLAPNEEGDFFALLSDKQVLTTKDGKPYFRVAFRDAEREVSFPVWSDSPLAEECRDQWSVGEFYKLRAKYRETNYGPQLDIHKIRRVEEGDAAEGFSPAMCQPTSQFNAADMLDDLVELAEEAIDDQPLKQLVIGLHERYREELLVLPAAQRNHHAFVGGYLEHVRNVARNAHYLATEYARLYPDVMPAIDVGITVAGAILHDIGKLRELRTTPAGAEYTAAGTLIGHILQGRDLVREAAAEQAAAGEGVDQESLLRLEHIIVSHQRLPEWGSPKQPMTPEALLVHYADDCDAKLKMMLTILEEDPSEGPMTGRRNVLGHSVYRGGE